MFASKIGMKCMNHRALNIFKSKLGVAWIAAFLFVTMAAPSEI
jgi:hypothetical protein